MVTRSTEEAMAVLKTYRRYLIDYGRYVAGEIALAQGTVHSREVINRMEQDGIFEMHDPVKDYWVGAVFNTKTQDFFKSTGQQFRYSDTREESKTGRGYNIHERTVTVWKLIDPKRRPPKPAAFTVSGRWAG